MPPHPHLHHLLALLLPLLASAQPCPNLCSGNGECHARVCACNSGYTGADCSLRTCPLGRAFDQISSLDDRVGHIFYTSSTGSAAVAPNNLQVFVDSAYALTRDETIHVRVADATAMEFQWKFASDAFYQQPVAMEDNEWSSYLLTDHTTSGSPTLGVRVWFTNPAATVTDDFWSFTLKNNHEIYWTEQNDNTLHQMVQCSGRGNCNSGTGRCECFVGYSGEACQRTTCPSDCSGHGICQDQKHFASDAGKSYTETGILGPYDATKQMGCLCDLGFRGPDCSMIECPSGADPLGPDPQGIYTTERNDCSGRGICNYGTGQCACFKGYFGERCETQSNYI